MYALYLLLWFYKLSTSAQPEIYTTYFDMHVVFNRYCALNILVASFWLYVYNMMLLSMCQS